MQPEVGADSCDGAELGLREVEDAVALVEQHQAEPDQAENRALEEAEDERLAQLGLDVQGHREQVEGGAQEIMPPSVFHWPGWVWLGSVWVQFTVWEKAPVPPKC